MRVRAMIRTGAMAMVRTVFLPGDIGHGLVTVLPGCPFRMIDRLSQRFVVHVSLACESQPCLQ